MKLYKLKKGLYFRKEINIVYINIYLNKNNFRYYKEYFSNPIYFITIIMLLV